MATVRTANPVATSTTKAPVSGPKTDGPVVTPVVAGPKKIYLGAAVVNDGMVKPAYVNALKTQGFTSITPANAMKFNAIEPQQGQFTFAKSDALVDFATANGMRVRGHTLVWWDANPAWVSSLTNDQASAALENHIKTEVGRYKGRVAEWDVVNEAIDANGGLRKSVWKDKLGDDYIAQSFIWAHQADPSAKLYYNEFSFESVGTAKSDGVYNMVKSFKARGIPIDGIGFQTHADLVYPGTAAGIQANMIRLHELGVDTEITEIDVRADLDVNKQAQRYADLGAACRAAGCTGVTQWGVYDGMGWYADQKPLILDDNYQPKPAYYALTKAIWG